MFHSSSWSLSSRQDILIKTFYLPLSKQDLNNPPLHWLQKKMFTIPPILLSKTWYYLYASYMIFNVTYSFFQVNEICQKVNSITGLSEIVCIKMCHNTTKSKINNFHNTKFFSTYINKSNILPPFDYF